MILPRCAGNCKQGRRPCTTPACQIRVQAGEITQRNAALITSVDRAILAVMLAAAALCVVLLVVWGVHTYALAVALSGVPVRRRPEADEELSPESRVGATPLRPALDLNPVERLMAAMTDLHHEQCQREYRAGFWWGWVCGVCSATATAAAVLAVAGWKGF
jgi:hypothetical protein